MTPTGPELPGMTLVQLLGVGGFAEVYLYERHYPRGRVAVKVLRSAVLSDVQRRQFVAEADAMAELAEHPFIVPVYGAGTTPDGRPYLVMAYYPHDLARRMREKPLAVPEVLRFGIQLASAVETAHRSGIVHRDIKPSNVLLNSYGVMGLSDFGIASRPADRAADEQVGVSLPWSPREVLIGESDGSVRSDVYSLGATLWTLLVGRAPFNQPGGDNSDRAMISRIVHGRPAETRRPDVPASLDRLLLQTMAKDPAHRPQSALELARHLQRIEQELRLARTEIVVLDQVRPPAAPTSAPTSGPPVGPADGATTYLSPGGGTARPIEPPATRLKGPMRVDGQSPVPTTAKPRVTPGPGAGAPADAEETAGGRRGLLLGLVGLVVAAAVAIAVLLASHGGGTPDDGSVPPPPQDTGGGGLGLDTLAPPTGLTGHVEGDHAVFTWHAAQGAVSYNVTYSVGRGPALVHQPRLRVPRHGGRVCIGVASVGSDGEVSPGGEDVCAG